jgi:hypothetical protein
MWRSVFPKSRQVGHPRRGAGAALRAGVVATLNVIGGAGLAQESREPALQANHSARMADLAPVQADAVYDKRSSSFACTMRPLAHLIATRRAKSTTL